MGALKKSKGRKRGEGGRMTRSVRQHMTAPLELLSEYPVRVSAMPLSTPAQAPISMSSSDAGLLDAAHTTAPVHAQPSSQVALKKEHERTSKIELTAMDLAKNNALKVEAAQSTHASPATTLPMMPVMPAVSNQMMTEVPSNEQLEMVLDDLPMLDADDSFTLDALDPAFLTTPASIGDPLTIGQRSNDFDLRQHSIDNSSASVSEDDGSANSGSSIPSASPQSSPKMMSRSPSP